MRDFTLSQRLRYAFDNTMSRGTVALIGWLGLASLLLIAFFSLLVIVLGGTPTVEGGSEYSFIDVLWMSLMRTLDAGTMGGDSMTWPDRWTLLLPMLGVSLGGVFIVSTLIGVLTAGVEGKVDDLRKGRSMVVETNHSVILGWSEQVFTVIRELIVANGNQKYACIVVLAEQDKVEMEDAIRDKVGPSGRTKIVCRTGSPIDPGDLAIVNLAGARSIVVLAPEDDDPDAQVIKTILAITNSPNRRKEPYHIVAEIREHKNMEAARLVGGDEAQIVETGDLIARVIVQTCRQSGLSVVYTELLDFGGDEIYFSEEPGLTGKTLGDALLAYEDSAIIGLQFKDGRVALNPPADTVIQAGDKVVAVSEDDDTVKLSGLTEYHIDESAIRHVVPERPAPERTLILGWNERATRIVMELDRYVAPGSEIAVVAENGDGASAIEECCGSLQNQTVSFRKADTTDRATLEGLHADSYDHIIVLCYDHLDIQRADARTLITLLHLRDIEARTGCNFAIVSEMLDVRNRELAEVTHADDFIVSNKLVSLMLAQISENRYLNALFQDLFDPEGSEIYLKPIKNYVELGKPVNFYTVVESARRCGQVAIGYRQIADCADASRAYGVVVNPDKSKMVTFAEGDKVVVVAED